VGTVLSSLFLGTEEIPWCDAVTDLDVDVVINGRLRFDYATLPRLRLLKFLTPKLGRSVRPCFFHISSTAPDMCLIFVVITTYPHAGMNSWVCLFLIIMIFMFYCSFSS
jgi:hypothetical protein